MTRAQAEKAVEVIRGALLDDSDEGESLSLAHLEVRAKDDEGIEWIVQSDFDDRDEDQWVHRTFVTVIDAAGVVIDNYEEH
jgi:hypothetical protein